MSQHDDTTRIETLLDESDRSTAGRSTGTDATALDAGTTEATPTVATSAEDATSERPTSGAGPTASSPTTQYAPYQGTTVVPEYKSGPAPTTSVVGLLGLLTVIAVLLAQATDLDIPWGVVGPVAVVGSGVLLVVLGLAGLRGQRYRG